MELWTSARDRGVSSQWFQFFSQDAPALLQLYGVGSLDGHDLLDNGIRYPFAIELVFDTIDSESFSLQLIGICLGKTAIVKIIEPQAFTDRSLYLQLPVAT